MAMNTGDPIETYLIDLALKTDSVKADADKFMKDLENQLGQGSNRVANTVSSNLAGMSQAVITSTQSMITTLVQTKNPLAAISSGIMTFNGAVQSAAQSGASWAQSLTGLVGGLAALVTVLAVVTNGLQTVIGFMQKTAAEGEQLAARVQTLNTGLSVTAKNAGVSMDLVRQKIGELQASGITTQASMESLLKFLSQSMPIENIGKLSRAAQDMAVAFGKNSSETFDRFVYSIMTGNSQMLRMDGIMKTANQMQAEYAASIGKTANTLTALENRQAIVNGIIEAAKGYTGLYEKSLESLGKRIQSLPRYIEEGTLAFGETMTPALDLATTAAEKFWKQFQALFVVLQEVEQDGVLKKIPVLLADGTQQLTPFGQKIRDAAQWFEDRLLPALLSVIKALPDMATQAGKVIDVFLPLTKLEFNNFKTLVDVVIQLYKQLDSLFITLTKGTSIWEAISKSVEGFVLIATIGLSVTNSLITGLDQKLRGEATTAWTDWKDNAKNAINQVMAAMNPVDTSKMTPDQMQAAYTKETGLSPFQQGYMGAPGGGTVGGGVQGPAAVAQSGGPEKSQAYLDWLKAHGENPYFVGAEDKRGAGTPAAKPEEDESVIAARKKAFLEGGKEIQNSFDQLNEAIIKSNEKFYGPSGAVAKFNEDVVKAEQKLSDELTKALDKAREALAKAIARSEVQYGRQLADLDKQVNQAKADENKSYHEQQVQEEEAFQIKMRRLNQDYTMSMEDAIQNRDARGMLQLMRKHAVDVQRANEDQAGTVSKDEENHNKRLSSIDQQAQDQRDRLKEAHDQQLQDMRDQEKENEDQMQENYRDRMTELIKNADERRQEMIDAHAKELQDLKDGQANQMKAIVKHWADVGILDSTSAEDLLHKMDVYYGKNGKIEKLITDFVDRNLENEAIVITLKTGAEAVAAATPSTTKQTTSCPPGQSWSYIAGACMPNEVIGHGYATGGVVHATKPTMAMFGEGGQGETAMFLPDNARMSLSQAGGLLSGGSGGSKSALDVTLKVEASGTITPEFEDAILAKLADVVMMALPNARMDSDR